MLNILYIVAAILAVPASIFVFSRLSGWRTLAERYPCHEPPPRPRKWLGYAVFRGWIGYNGGMVISCDVRGLFLAAWPMVLSFCHEPIFIPWPEIREIRAQRHWYGTTYEIHTRRAPEVRCALRSRTFAFVKDHAIGAGVRGNYAA